MIKMTLNKTLFGIVCFVMALGFLTACKKNNDTAADNKVELLSFGASGAQHGEDLVFIGHNLNKVTAIEFVGSSVSAAGFKQHTPERIVLVIPAATQEGFVKLKTGDTTIVSKTKINFNISTAIKITSITSSSNPVRPGDNITIKGDFVNWIKEVRFSKDLPETTFVSKTLNELVVKVPKNAQTGFLIFSTGGTKPVVIETLSAVPIALPAVTSLSPNPADRLANLTITGTNLDLTKGVLLKGLTTPITTFVSQSPTQIVLKIPKEANKGVITLIAYSSVAVDSKESLAFNGELPPLAPLAYAFYIDDLANGWQDWGWNRTANNKSTDNIRDGLASMKVDYTANWGAVKFASKTVSLAAYSELAFSIFGTPGTAGKKINVTPKGGTTFTVVLEEGKWNEYKVAKATIGNPADITELVFSNEDWTGTIFLDHVGLR